MSVELITILLRLSLNWVSEPTSLHSKSVFKLVVRPLCICHFIIGTMTGVSIALILGVSAVVNTFYKTDTFDFIMGTVVG